MTKPEFIDTLIRGGWGGKFKEKPVITMLENNLIGFSYPGSFDGISVSLFDIVLQPVAWQAYHHAISPDLQESTYKMAAEQEMIDLVREINRGKSVEQYIESL